MKRLILAAITMLLLTSTQLLNAQSSPAIALFDKYGGKDGFTTVSISKELFGMFADMKTDDPDAKDVKAMMEQLDGIKILMYETKDSSNTNDADLARFKDEIGKLQVGTYTELMVVKQPGEEVKFLVQKKGDKIGELLLLINSKKEAGFISITGTIDMATIGKLSKTMNFEGMENLNKLNEEKK
jgi:hypothetical protein